MSQYQLLKTEHSQLADWKQRYLTEATDPLDGMWQSFVASAEHFQIVSEDRAVGYCVVDSDRKMLQFFIDTPEHLAAFNHALLELNVQSAVVSTCENLYLTACREQAQGPAEVIALMYHAPPDATIDTPVWPSQSNVRAITSTELEAAVMFAVESIQADETWLRNYYAERIRGDELFGLWQDHRLIAVGECRPSQIQPPCADIGMIVAPDYRGRGIATNLLRWLIRLCRDRGFRAICSTESDNLAAQAAIKKAGFVQYHEILQFSFAP